MSQLTSHSSVPRPRDAVDLEYRLEDAITRPQGRVFASGTQALVRMLVMQRLADRRDGLKTAGFVSGYRGSPLAGVDTELWRSASAIAAHDIRFMPGVNEDLAATAVAGTQRVAGDPLRSVSGVFALWYGKGPGVDRAGDAIRHGHAAGASKTGGVLMAVGDDHAATSSSIPNASDLSLMGWSIPIVHPESVDEYVAFGLWGWAASRFSGAWVALKAISETVESSRSFVAPELPRFVTPDDFAFPPDGLGYDTRSFLTPAIEVRMVKRLDALAAFARANPLDRMLVETPGAEIGIVAVGKSARDALEVLERFGLPPERLADAGIRVWRPGLVYPLDAGAFAGFARGLRHILVIEEKASLVESQIKDICFNWPADRRPGVCGKAGLDGAPLISALGQHRPATLARPIATWLACVRPDLAFADRLPAFERPDMLSNPADGLKRLPYFCSGCPHNTSTKVPKGSIALAGVGCHFMASWMDRETSGLTQMGGEGVDWTGQAPFTALPHVFQNMGEGTYYHSGYLAIRQAIASGANVTYKILFNDAVAMTGGQPVDGPISVPQIAQQMSSEGAKAVAIVTDAPERYSQTALPAGVKVHHRGDLGAVQRDMREIAGVTALIYDQTCAAEKRRRRKRGRFPDPDRRIFINSAVCEGCGDCGRASNCLSVVPLETEYGRKRAIDQTSCNKDFSCVEGFCPSFVSVIGGRPRRGTAAPRDWTALAAELSKPRLPTLGQRPHNLLIGGVGGSGIITVGAVVAMAAHLDGLAVAELDFTALAQKGGSVMCHLRIAAPGRSINQPRIDWGEADAVIMGDLIVGCLPDSLGTVRRGRTLVLANTHVGSTAEFTRDPEATPQVPALLAKVRHATGDGALTELDANAVARNLFGDTTAVNMLLIGHAWQQGLIPVSEAALMQAIALNGVAIEANRRAFACGRVLAAEGQPQTVTEPVLLPSTVEELTERRVRDLTTYQNAAYAARYRRLVEACVAAERRLGEADGFSRAVANVFYKLMAYKDEYEVARLYTRPEFAAALREAFEGEVSLRFHLAPPLIAPPVDGETPRKMTFGPWMMPAFKILAWMRPLRGTMFDPFGYTHERRTERRLIDSYESHIRALLQDLSALNYATAIEIAELPMTIRGFGHVKLASVEKAQAKEARLLARFHTLGERLPPDARDAA